MHVMQNKYTKNYTSYATQVYETFQMYFKFVTSIVSEIYYPQKSGDYKKFNKFFCLIRIHDL